MALQILNDLADAQYILVSHIFTFTVIISEKPPRTPELTSSLNFKFNSAWLAVFQKVFCIDPSEVKRSDSSVSYTSLLLRLLQWHRGGLAQGMQLKKAE